MSAPGVDLAEPILTILREHVSAPTARSVLGSARLRAELAPGPISHAGLTSLVETLTSGLRLFLPDPEAVRLCRAKLLDLARRTASQPGIPAAAPSASPALAPSAARAPVAFNPKPEPLRERAVMSLTSEADLGPARSMARRVAITVFASLLWQTRVVTITSELARNIVQYAGSGEIAIQVIASGRCLEIIATDQGPGIPHLDSIFAGTYRSQGGMGQGLRGVKAVCDEFEIRPNGFRGTYVRAVLRAL